MKIVTISFIVTFIFSRKNFTGTHSPLPPPLQKTLGILLEQALQEAPALLLRRGKAAEALERYRATLCAIEAQGVNAIRLKFMCQMAELLLQGLACEEYTPPIESTPKMSIWKPKQYALLNQVIHEKNNIF